MQHMFIEVTALKTRQMERHDAMIISINQKYSFAFKKNEWNAECNTVLVPRSYTPLLIFMHYVIILTQNEAMGASPPSLAVAAPIHRLFLD